MLAQLTSWIANTGFKSPEKQTSPVDFMPSQWLKKSKSSKPKRIRITKKRRNDIFYGLRAMLMPKSKVL